MYNWKITYIEIDNNSGAEAKIDRLFEHDNKLIVVEEYIRLLRFGKNIYNLQMLRYSPAKEKYMDYTITINKFLFNKRRL